MADDVEVFGVGVLGPPPLGTINLELKPGLSVLYGVNGAGKTRVLEALRAAFNPRPAGLGARVRRQGSAMLYARWTPDLASLVTSRLREAARDLWKTKTVSSGEDFVDVPEWLTFDAEPYQLMHGMVELASAGNSDLAGEVASQECLILVNGDLWLGACLSEHTPQLRQLWDANRTLARRMTSLGKTPPEARAEQALLYAMGEITADQPPIMLRAAWEVELNEAALPAPWIPLPIVSLGEYYGSFGEVLSDAPFDTSQRTVEYLRSVGVPVTHPMTYRALLMSSVDGAVVIDPDVADLAARLSSRASEIAMILMLDAPVLQCVLRDPNEWALGPALEWHAYDSPAMVWVKLAELSRAQQRWAFVAIKIAVKEMSGERFGALIIDEPEEALHARAERHLVNGLERLGAELGIPVVVASHSADALRSERAQLLHVSRDKGGQTAVASLRVPIREAIGELGLDPADALQLVRVFVVVEGRHDQLVLESLLSDELDELRARVVPARGGSQIAAVTDSQLMFDYTTAAVLVVVDNVSATHARAVWNQAREHARGGDLARARKVLDEGFSRRVAEERFLKEFCWKAIDRGQLERVDVWAFAKPDIVMYLPVERLVPKASTWERLQEQHADHSGRDFKGWLQADCSANFSDGALLDAVASMDEVSAEFSELIGRIGQVSNWRSGAPPGDPGP